MVNFFRVATKMLQIKNFSKIYRYNPDSNENPRIDSYELDLDDCGPMVLDAIIKIKK